MSFMGPLIPLFWTFGDISSGCQSQSGWPSLYLSEAYIMNIPWVSPLVWHLSTSGWPAWQLVIVPHMHVLGEVGCQIGLTTRPQRICCLFCQFSSIQQGSWHQRVSSPLHLDSGEQINSLSNDDLKCLPLENRKLRNLHLKAIHSTILQIIQEQKRILKTRSCIIDQRRGFTCVHTTRSQRKHTNSLFALWRHDMFCWLYVFTSCVFSGLKLIETSHVDLFDKIVPSDSPVFLWNPCTIGLWKDWTKTTCV